MSLIEPDRLELSYIRAMLAGLLFTGGPGRVLLLGLGGGSLAKFLFRHFPDCRIEAVEYRPEVVDVAYRFFDLPRDPRLAVHVAEGCEYLCREAVCREAEYDHIFVDAYDPEGLSASINEQAFFAAGARLLHPEGVFSMNLWKSHPESFRHSLKLLDSNFDRRILRLQVAGWGNVIGFGLGSKVKRPGSGTLKQQAKLLEQRLGIEFPRLLQRLSSS